MSRPVTIDRYPGTSGSTHGDRNETNPPANASTYAPGLTFSNRENKAKRGA
jgi:hypothetical protein